MAKFVIAACQSTHSGFYFCLHRKTVPTAITNDLLGKANCPYYAKAELLADYLQKNLPDFRIFKITQHPDVWEEWLEDVCEENEWEHSTSPIIWRELLDRGGKGLLLGGYNEFLEHAQLYYGVTSSMATELMMVIANENLQAHIKEELEKETMKDLISPLQVWIASAGANVCYHIIPLLASGEVFGMHTKISLTLFDREQMEDALKSLAMEIEDLASPIVHSISLCTRTEEAFHQAQVIIILDDSTDEEVYTLESCLRSKVPLCRRYAYLMKKNAHESVKVIVGGKVFVNLKTALLIHYAPHIAGNIIAVALGVEGQAKAKVARKMKTTSASIKDVIIWGNISGNNYVDLRKAKVYNYESAIKGPPGYYHSVLGMIFDREWIRKDFVMMLQGLSNTGKEFGGILGAHSIATTLKYWYQGSPPGEIVSLGIMSEGQFGIPEGVVFSMPVKFENGTWEVLTDLEDISLTPQIINRLVDDLIQEKRVALGDIFSFQPVQEDSKLNFKKVKGSLSDFTNDNQEEQKTMNEHKDSTHSSVGQDEEKEQAASDDSEGKSEDHQ